MWRKEPLFEPCSSCVAVDSFFFQKKDDFWKNETPEKGHFKVIFDNFCPSVPMSIFFGGRGGGDDDDDATTRRRQIWDYLAPPSSHPGTEYLVRNPLTLIFCQPATDRRPTSGRAAIFPKKCFLNSEKCQENMLFPQTSKSISLDSRHLD